MTIQIRKFPHQKGMNGPLDDIFKARVQKVRTEGNLSLEKLARELDISGTFLSNLLRHDAHVRSVHVPRFASAIERLEKELGINDDAPGAEDDTTSATAPESVSIEELIRYAHRQGFAVTFTPIDGRTAPGASAERAPVNSVHATQ